ncbi:hypothetical protein F383_23072 [Gossypium arboreum]|uniref:Uncharacterized protein n=1 Tax=Gossypium arboreum TaxID=29729 RepID=A0A0B0NNC6_GOSAR|nr:hypothetical protein F383_23072 [Gossypium arboreum]
MWQATGNSECNIATSTVLPPYQNPNPMQYVMS